MIYSVEIKFFNRDVGCIF